jgi:hypothetical protein
MIKEQLLREINKCQGELITGTLVHEQSISTGFTACSSEVGQIFKRQHDIQLNYNLYHVQVLTLVQPMVQEHGSSA